MDTNDIHINLPSSKSISNRWLLVNYLCGNSFRLIALSDSDDTQLLRALLYQLYEKKSNTFYCNNAGTVARFITALLAVTPGSYLVTGDERLRQRPIAPLVDALCNMGLSVEYNQEEGFFPLFIKGGLPTRKMVTICPTLSSQFVSALMLIAPSLPNGLTLTLSGKTTSKPYIDLTAHILRSVGVEVKQSRTGGVISVGTFPESLPLRSNVYIEKDWTSASYFYLMATLIPGRRIRLVGLSRDSVQGDSVVEEIFAKLGVKTLEVRSPYRKVSRSLCIIASGKIESRIFISLRNYPDLMPAVAVACAALGVSAYIRGVENLRHKESDRIHAVATELSAMGASIQVLDKELRIRKSVLKPVGHVKTYGDHRIAMAFAPLKLRFPDLVIENPDVVSKSFPDFWNQFNAVLNDGIR